MLMRLRVPEVLKKVACEGKRNVVLGEKGLAARIVNGRDRPLQNLAAESLRSYAERTACGYRLDFPFLGPFFSK